MNNPKNQTAELKVYEVKETKEGIIQREEIKFNNTEVLKLVSIYSYNGDSFNCQLNNNPIKLFKSYDLMLLYVENLIDNIIK